MIKWVFIGAALMLSPVEATAQQSSVQCELHIWPTSDIYAAYLGASVSWNGYGAQVDSVGLSPLEQVAVRLGESIDPVAQRASLESMKLGQFDRFHGYRLYFHDAPADPKYRNWVAKDVGNGARDADSNAKCYAELHVVFVTLLKTTIVSKKIQTGFLFRDFGASGTAQSTFVDVGSTGAPAFDTNGKEKSEAAKESVRAAFRENLRIFLKKKKMRPVVSKG